MSLHVFLFLLVVCLLSLALLGRLPWPHLQLSHAQAGRRRTLVHRLLKPRTPRDCPLCRLCSSSVRPAPAPVRPWREMKSRRGAPKRVNTQGFACPNQQCPYYGITDADIHALVGDGKHGQAERIQTFRCQACRTTFTSRRHTPLYRLKTPSHQVAMVLCAGRRAGCLRGRTGLRLPSAHHHLMAHSRRGPCPDLTRALLPPSLAPAPPTGRTAHTAALYHTGVVALAGHRPLHKASARAPSRPTHAKRSAYGHPLPATHPGPWLSAALHQ